MATLTHPLDALADHFELAFSEIDGQLFVSQGRCVDLLLDLFCATHDDAVRRVISGGLSEIRHLNIVRGSDLRACLLLAAAFSASEPAPVDAETGQ